MSKKSMNLCNDYCPQTLFLYGVYKEDGTPNFGLFCWASYCWDAELGFMASIGGEKLTKDMIHKNKVFSANLVTQELLPFADYCGNTYGRDCSKELMSYEVEPGQVLSVPLLKASPVSFELEVKQSIVLDGSEVFLCKIRNLMMDESLCDNTLSIEERLQRIAPVSSTCNSYFSWKGNSLGMWGEPMKGTK